MDISFGKIDATDNITIYLTTAVAIVGILYLILKK
jgi:hypothetical protein